LAEALLSLCLPGGGYRESVLGDLEEAYRGRVACASGRRGPGWWRAEWWSARWWYWKNALGVGAGYAVRRLLRHRRYRTFDQTTERTRTERTRMGGTRMGGVATMVGEVLTDVRFAIRWFRRAPGFLAIALVTLALSIGANAAIFSVVDAVYLEPLPFDDPGSLVRMGLAREDRPGTMSVHTAGDFREWRERTTVFESMAAWAYRTVTVEHGDVAERMTVAISVGSLFDVLGRSAAVGRTFSEAEEGPGAEHLAVLSHALWRQAFGGGDVIGSTIRIQGAPHEVIGVMPADFAYPSGARLWVTAPFDAETLSARNNFFLRTVARLRPGVGVEQARDEARIIGRDVQERLPETYGGIEIVVEPMNEWLQAGVGNLWWILMAGVTLVLLIGCGNLANLLLSRGTNRQGELAVRRALGARGGRLVRQALTESTLLALAGGALGVLLAHFFLDLLLAWMPGGVPRAESVNVDPGVLVFTLMVSVTSGLLFGALPAARARRVPIGARLGWGRRTHRPELRGPRVGGSRHRHRGPGGGADGDPGRALGRGASGGLR
jgi:putative ABC transport system permease protein